MKYIFFDMDGTLLPMNPDAFMKIYFKNMAIKLAPYGYDSKMLIDGIWKGTVAMTKNDGSKTNEQVFWEDFAETFQRDVLQDLPIFEEYYQKEFQLAKEACGKDERACHLIEQVKLMNIPMALTTNPVFPMMAQKSRLQWAGLKEEDFTLITAYENSHYCKPNPKYYLEVLQKVGCAPEDCLMVGNDLAEDIVPAKQAGMKVFLLKDYILNKNNLPFEEYPQGSYEELLAYIQSFQWDV